MSEGGVKIHYATIGQGPLVVMIHGFPDFWYSWRHQMEGLADKYQVVAVDQRGYNLSDQPKGVENYDMRLLVGDVAAVIKHLGQGEGDHRRARLGRRGGLAVRAQRAADDREPHHPATCRTRTASARELRTNQDQIKNSEYARNFQTKSADDPTVFFGMPMTPQTMAGWVKDPAARAHYVEAFERSDREGMLNYYKQNYPRGVGETAAAPPELPKAKMSVLMFHGLDDTALDSDALSGTWDWLEKDLTLVTIPGAGHFVQQDAAQMVTDTMKWWLALHTAK